MCVQNTKTGYFPIGFGVSLLPIQATHFLACLVVISSSVVWGKEKVKRKGNHLDKWIKSVKILWTTQGVLCGKWNERGIIWPHFYQAVTTSPPCQPHNALCIAELRNTQIWKHMSYTYIVLQIYKLWKHMFGYKKTGFWIGWDRKEADIGRDIEG